MLYQKKDILKESIFSYIISYSKCEEFPYNKNLAPTNYVLSYSDGIEINFYNLDNIYVYIIGYAIDSYNEHKTQDIPKMIASEYKKGIEQSYNYCNRLAGKYIVLLFDSNNRYIWGDATNSLTINYNFSKGVVISSIAKMVAEYSSDQEDPKHLDIRLNSTLSQPMPSDITIYNSVYSLLPNHYLDISNRKTVRVNVSNGVCKNSKYSESHILEKQFELIDSITKQYAKDYECVCPLTAGYDSRAVYSFLLRVKEDIETYTFFHNGFTMETPDVKIPKQIRRNLNHKLVNDIEATEEYYNAITSLNGKTTFRRTVDLAYTYNSIYKGKTLINGNILDQVGKSLIGNSLHSVFATPSFFVCKIHNKSKHVKPEIKKWIDTIGEEDRPFIYDLFAIENRLGRWAAQTDQVYNLCGINSMNIFNCKDLIFLWMSLDRKKRKNKILYKYIYEKNLDSYINDIPINGSRIMEYIKTNVFTFYIGTYLKQVLKR